MYNDPTTVIIIILAVLAGGLIKGTIGFGMPMVALPIIAFTIPATTAMILLCAPIFLTNFLQIQFKQGISSYRFLPMFLFLVFGLIVGARLILEINLNTVTQIIAISIIFADMDFVASNAIGLLLRVWGLMGTIETASIVGWRIGPPADNA